MSLEQAPISYIIKFVHEYEGGKKCRLSHQDALNNVLWCNTLLSEITTQLSDYIIENRRLNNELSTLVKSSYDSEYMKQKYEEINFTSILLQGRIIDKVTEQAHLIKCINIQRKYLSVQEVDPDEIYCFLDPKCDICKKYNHLPIKDDRFDGNYCLNKCAYCHKKRLARKLPEGNINSRDKYFYFELNGVDETGEVDDTDVNIKQRLITNFNSLAPPSYPAICKIYGFVGLKLIGLIRYDNTSKYRISIKAAHIRNVFKHGKTGKRVTKPFQVEDLSPKSLTKIDAVISKYELISSLEEVIGPSIDQFINS